MSPVHGWVCYCRPKSRYDIPQLQAYFRISQVLALLPRTQCCAIYCKTSGDQVANFCSHFDPALRTLTFLQTWLALARVPANSALAPRRFPWRISGRFIRICFIPPWSWSILKHVSSTTKKATAKSGQGPSEIILIQRSHSKLNKNLLSKNSTRFLGLQQPLSWSLAATFLLWYKTLGGLGSSPKSWRSCWSYVIWHGRAAGLPDVFLLTLESWAIQKCWAYKHIVLYCIQYM